MMMTIESLHSEIVHEIMNESAAFDIASSMIQGDITFNSGSQSVLSSIGSPSGYRPLHGLVDYGDAKLDDELLFQNVVGSSDLNACGSLSTRLRRRKATQPQRLVYCDLDYNSVDGCSTPINAGSVTDPLGLHFINESTVESDAGMSNGEANMVSHQISLDLSHENEEPVVEVVSAISNSSPETIQPPEEDEEQSGEVERAELKCDICNAVCPTKSKLRSHRRSHTKGKKDLKCDICSKEFRWEYSWKTHVQAHSEDNPNKCEECDMKFFNKTALMNHVKRIHQSPERPFSCDVCPKKFISKSELNQHSVSHSTEKNFVCDQCGKAFASKSYLERHCKTHAGLKRFKCDHCGKSFADKTGFTAHVRAHLGERPFACDICGKSYTIKRHLSSHMIIHSDARPFKCEECGKTFRSRTNFRMHKDSHLGLKRWACKFCNRTFLSQGNMAKHVRRHVGEKNHKCTLCGKAFIEKQELKNHSKMHTNDKGDKFFLLKQPEKPAVPSSVLESFSSEQSVCLNGVPIGSNFLLNSVIAGTTSAEPDLQNLVHFSLPPEPDHGSVTPVHLHNSSQNLTSHSSLDATSSVTGSGHVSLLNGRDVEPLPHSNDCDGKVSPSTTCFTTFHEELHHPVVNCSLCSNYFQNSNLLKEHLVEYHRVEPEKVLTTIY